MRIAVIATGVGNVRSVVRALEHVLAGALSPPEIVTTAEPDVVRRADVLVVPGQGAFGAFAGAVVDHVSGLDGALVEQIRGGTPFLGICLGLQILFEESDEAPGVRGLAIFPGRVRRLEPGTDPATQRPHPLPHVGWNRAESESALVAPEHYYFAHSYAAVPSDPTVAIATTTYGSTFTSAIRRDNVVGVQFHPEKSQRAGLDLLGRFFSTIVKART